MPNMLDFLVHSPHHAMEHRAAKELDERLGDGWDSGFRSHTRVVSQTWATISGCTYEHQDQHSPQDSVATEIGRP